MRARASSTAACERDLEPTPHLAACALCRTKHEVTTTWCMRTRGVHLVSTVARRAHERAKGRAMAHDGTAWWTRKTVLARSASTTTTATSPPSADDEIAANDAKARLQSSVLATFGAWFASRGGATHSCLRMTFRPNSGWSLEADSAIGKGEQLVKLPKKLMLSCDSEDVSAPLREVMSRVPSDLWSSKLGLLLVRERIAAQHSLFAPYITLLPSVHEGNPLFFQHDAVVDLQYAPLVAQIRKRSKFLVQLVGRGATVDDGEDFVNAEHPDRRRVVMEVDANALGWASACASSRAFKVRGPTSTPSMLPVIDVCNHSFTPSAAVRLLESGDGDVELVATRDLDAGEAIELNYGNLSNDDLLLDYGFIIENNPYDVVKLRWDLKLIELAREIGGLATAPIGAQAAEESLKGTTVNVDDVMQITSWQHAALQRIGLVGDASNVELDIHAHGVDKKLLAGLRVLYSKSPTEASRAADAPYGEIGASVVFPDTEIKALRCCMSLAALALGNFQTTLEEDKRILEECSSANAQAMKTKQQVLAIRFRVEKKKILSGAMAKLNEAIAREQK